MAKITVKKPGAVLLSFIEEYGLNPSRLGTAVKLSQSTIRQITLDKMKISIPVALRFAKFFGNPVEFWTDLQTKYELEAAAKDPELSALLKEIQKVKKPAPGKKEAVKKTAEKKAKPAAKKVEVKKPAAKKPGTAKRGRKPGSGKKA